MSVHDGQPQEADPARSNGWPSPRIVYAPQYNIGFAGLERLHPFDSRKYGRAWRVLERELGELLRRSWVKPRRPVSRTDLLGVHTAEYLQQLRRSSFVARVLEVPQLGMLPGWLVDWAILCRMRWATMGTIVAATEAMKHGLAINLSGGYHHASPKMGHGFSAYADVGLAIHHLRQSRQLEPGAKVVYIDLDAHQGNGVCRTFFDDRSVMIYDQYNQHIFPMDVKAQRRIDCDVPLPAGCDGTEYLAMLKARLPVFLDAIGRSGSVGLGIYNAGTDIFSEDQLGGLNVSAEDVLERDRFVLSQLVRRKIRTLVVLSGGYSARSYQLVAAMVEYVLRTWGSPG